MPHPASRKPGHKALIANTFFRMMRRNPNNTPSNTMKTIIRSILLLSLTATVLGLSSCQTTESGRDEMPRMNHAGMRMN